MRKITFGGACSLDNYLARPDGAVDWLLWSDEAGAVMKDYWQRIDTLLMGRKTYEIAVGHAQSAQQKKSRRPNPAKKHAPQRIRMRA